MHRAAQASTRFSGLVARSAQAVRCAISVPCAMILVAAVQPVRAADAPDPQAATTLQEVVVTAQKREEKIHDIPLGITAVTSRELDEERLTDLADLQSKVPGLSIQQTVPGQERITIRGQNVGGDGSTVTYVDDTPFGSSNALANGSLLAGDFDTWDLARIEVLRGPQGTLYGAGSEGGLLKYVTNAPDPTRLDSAFQAGNEDVAHGQDVAFGKAMVNIPLGAIAAVRVSGFYAGVPGYINDPQLDERNVNRGYQDGLRASFLIQPSDDFSIRLTAFGQTLHTEDSPYIDVVGAAGTPLTPAANQLQPLHGNYDQYRYVNEPATFKYRIYSGTLNWNIGWGTATSITSYGTTDQDLVGDFTSALAAPGVTYGAYLSSLTGAPTGIVENPDDLHVQKLTQEFRLASSSGGSLEWLAGAFFTRESSSLDQALSTFLIPSLASTGLPSLETISLDSLYREWSVFGQATYRFTSQFDLTLGGRWSENKQSATQTTSGLLASPTVNAVGASTGTDFTYSIAPRWHLTQDTMLYARVATGYRPGGPNVLPPGAPAGVPTTYQSDSTVNYEIGARTEALEHRVSVDVDAFLVNWRRIQLLEYVESNGVNANGGSARSEGLEWTLGYAPLSGLSLSLTGSYVDAHLTSPALAAGGSDGDPLPYVPRWSGSLDGAYRWHAFGDYQAFTGATWSYFGSRRSDFSSSATVVNGAVGFVPNPRVDVGSYSTVNLRAGLEDSRWTIELYCKNLADSRGITYYLDQGTPGLGGQIGLTFPRTAGFSVTAHF